MVWNSLSALAIKVAIKRALVPRTPSKRLGNLLRGLKPLWPLKMIRVGNVGGNGGYLLPDDLAGIEYCFSPGVGAVASFEEDMLTRGVHSFLADFSVEGPPAGLAECTFDKRFLGSTTNGRFITLQDWVDKYLPHNYARPLLLQMDIEGGEYEVLRTAPLACLLKFRIMVVEFHGLEDMDLLPVFERFESVMLRLAPYFRIVHMHPNNAGKLVKVGRYEVPAVVELTFLRRDRPIEALESGDYPHPLDRRNVPYLPDLVMPRCWFDRSFDYR